MNLQLSVACFGSLEPSSGEMWL